MRMELQCKWPILGMYSAEPHRTGYIDGKSAKEVRKFELFEIDQR